MFEFTLISSLPRAENTQSPFGLSHPDPQALDTTNKILTAYQEKEDTYFSALLSQIKNSIVRCNKHFVVEVKRNTISFTLDAGAILRSPTYRLEEALHACQGDFSSEFEQVGLTVNVPTKVSVADLEIIALELDAIVSVILVSDKVDVIRRMKSTRRNFYASSPQHFGLDTPVSVDLSLLDHGTLFRAGPEEGGFTMPVLTHIEVLFDYASTQRLRAHFNARR